MAALSIVVALAAQVQVVSTLGTLNWANFFSYFTVESNVAAVFVLLCLEFSNDTVLHRLATRLRGPVTLYMVMTGVIYNALLAPASADVSITATWTDLIVHTFGPLLMLVDWLLAPPPQRPRVRHIPGWLAFPMVYVAYSLIRGSIANWYPYPFFNPNLDGGAGKVAIAIAVLMPAVALIALGLVKLARNPKPS
ncbi:MAG: Pr6Pr family membrane protein [Actinobacteria bacterium]|nr:Pr6Pr family membrane protein [Actinomycetota bacterium]